MEIKNLAGNISYSLKNVTKIVALLKELREKCVRTGDNLNNCLLRIEVGLKKKIAAKKIKIEDMEK